MRGSFVCVEQSVKRLHLRTNACEHKPLRAYNDGKGSWNLNVREGHCMARYKTREWQNRKLFLFFSFLVCTAHAK